MARKATAERSMSSPTVLFAAAVTLGSQLLAPLSAARSEYAPTAGRPHALAKTMLLGAMALLGLECRFSHICVELPRRVVRTAALRPIWLKIELACERRSTSARVGV